MASKNSDLINDSPKLVSDLKSPSHGFNNQISKMNYRSDLKKNKQKQPQTF